MISSFFIYILTLGMFSANAVRAVFSKQLFFLRLLIVMKSEMTDSKIGYGFSKAINNSSKWPLI